MVALLAVLAGAGLAWLVRRQRERGTSLRADPVSPGPPPRSFDGKPIPAAQLADGRIVVSGLARHYEAVRAVDQLSFVVEPGRVTGFLGPNGAGKTTALRMILGLVTPTAGTATIGGTSYASLDQPVRRVGAVLESGGAHKGRTGRNHLRIICQSAGIPLARADEVLGLAGLTAAGGRKFGGYSLGMRQRLGIAAALLGDPQVLILDEPANGLDPDGIRWLRDLLRAMAASGRTVLVSSHLLAETALLADDLIIIAAGQLVARGTVAAVAGTISRPGRTLVRTSDVARLTAALGGDALITPGGDGDGDFYVTGADAAAIGDAAQRAGIAIHQLVTQRPDLEDAFLELTRSKAAIR
jgi:ABC-2 type transport system ATP-binding protein